MVSEYLELFAALRESGERVVIDGPCYSACTLVLTTIPHDRICVTRKAVLGFHAPRWVDRNGREYSAGDATRLVIATYPAAVRAWIKRHGGLTTKLRLLSIERARTSAAPTLFDGDSAFGFALKPRRRRAG